MKLAALAVAAACLLGACDVASPAYAACPSGTSQMGCSIVPDRSARIVVPTLNSGAPSGEWVPDVSSYQPNVDWAAVKAWQLLHGWKITGAIFKLGENVADPYALQNATDLHKDGMIAIGYWFIRPSGATEEAGEILAESSALHIHVVVLDEEVAGIAGYASVIAPILEKAGYEVVDYHSTENVLDATADGLPCWEADYGPLTPPRCTTGKRVAWQWTSTGTVPGITGQVDVSVSYGLLKLAEPPVVKPKPKPKPAPKGPVVCFGPKAHASVKTCGPIVAHHSWLTARRNLWHGVYAHDRCARFTRTERKNHPACANALHWYALRRGQAKAYLEKHS